MGLGDITTFIQDKYKTAKRVINDVTHAELMAEEATNREPLSPDARTMAMISEALFEFDDYWRIVDVLHRKFHCVDFKEWRQSYKSMVLLEFLLTHGPENFAEEFYCDVDVIEELGTFQYVDEHGFDWGSSMRKISERLVKLLKNRKLLAEARRKALKLSREIKGFGSSSMPSSPLASSPMSSPTISTSKSLSPLSSNERPDDDGSNRDRWILHGWKTASSPLAETGSLLNPSASASPSAAMSGKVALRGLSQVGKLMRRTFERQLSLGF